jgi:hypothetical protein
MTLFFSVLSPGYSLNFKIAVLPDLLIRIPLGMRETNENKVIRLAVCVIFCSTKVVLLFK